MKSLTKTKLGLVAVLSAALIAGATGLALANGRGGPDRAAKRAEMMKRADTNGDGKIDDAERAAMRATMQAQHEAQRKAMLAKYDANKDGKLDDAEHTAIRNDRAAERFKALDTNHDGALSLAEFQAGHAAFGPGGPGGHGRGGPDGHGPGGPGGPGGHHGRGPGPGGGR
ncbi:MAG: EF-hand domain-containing protein [Myxococcales bacterium]|nr:EF-hand domain-containing protein [Myxococcales bacterium]